MLNKWKCPRCGKTVTEYSTICDNLNCGFERGFWRWLINWDNPGAWVLGIAWSLLVTVIAITLLR